MKTGMVTNKMNRYLFYDNKMSVFTFQRGERKKKILLPTNYIYTEFGKKKFETFYQEFLKQYLRELEFEFLVEAISKEPVVLRENNCINEFPYRKICYYYMMERTFTESEWGDLQEKSYHQGLQVEMKPIDEFLSFNKKEYEIGINDTKACEALKRKLVKERK